ncbi:hypothetical protein [Dickeya sp. NCPPB 3274]|uniref:hypothetical protein n=1 Tax=Dickeya sp. NCPPB 3274 TaxID=568766 RepID=UPI0006ACF5DA|nr:hypothetical protein [Dickeya sp. NCPPB 3274]
MNDLMRVKPAPIERDECGLFLHPQHPADVNEPGELENWFRAHGLTYKINWLNPPEHKCESECQPNGDFSDWGLRSPEGTGWFLWCIEEASDGEPIALWVAPMNAVSEERDRLNALHRKINNR